MPNSIAEVSECGGDEEGRNEVNNEGGGGIRSRDEGTDDCESNSDSDSTVGLNGEEGKKLSSRVEIVGARYPTEYNSRGSSSEIGFSKRCENGDFANLGPDNKDTELRLGLPDSQLDVGSRPENKVFSKLLDPAHNLSKNEPNALIPKCSVISQAHGYPIQGQEYVSKEEFKLKPMFKEFTSPDLPFDARISAIENNNARVLTNAKRVFSETLESSRANASGEPKLCPQFNFQPISGERKLYLPSPIHISQLNFPFGTDGWRMKWEWQQQQQQQQQQQGNKCYSQFSGHMVPNEVKNNEAALTVKVKVPLADHQKESPVESLPSKNQTGTSSEQRTGTSSEQRVAPVVGWPPVRSFRKNFAPQPKLAPEPIPVPPAPVGPAPVAMTMTNPTNMFVKVNVEGNPIGRKIDLNAYDSYDKLALALDEMFRDSFPDQNPSSSSSSANLSSGYYVLVYEDDEGDRMLVGDVPWGMFVTTVKRLRIIRSSEARGLDRSSSLKKSKAGTC